MSKLKDAAMIEQLASELIHLRKDRYLSEMLQIKSMPFGGWDIEEEAEEADQEPVDLEGIEVIPVENRRRR